jgi:ornithine decarboxylase
MGEKYMIKGCTPASEDIFRYEVYLINPKVGDKLKFLNAGAYNYTTDFCSLKKIKTFII